MGANGVGSFATAVFSEYFEATSRDGKMSCQVLGSRGVLESTTIGTNRQKAHGCHVKFVPDSEFFADWNADHHLMYLKSRLENLARCFPKISFNFNGKDVKEVPFVGVAFQGKNGIVAIAPAPDEFQQVSFVNGLHCFNGGTHIDYFVASLVEPLRAKITKKHKIDLSPAMIKSKLFVQSWLTGLKNLSFDSQSKERITNTQKECSEFFAGFDFSKIAETIFRIESIIQPMIQAALFKKEQADRLALARAQKAKPQRIENHLECIGTVMKDRTLFIAEGDSAIDSLVSVRDPKLHGGYALRGKIMNTRGMKWVDIIKNKELNELMQVIGLHADGSVNLNYGNLAIMTDADVDGDGIYCLLLNFLSNWPILFKEGRVNRLRSPLWIAKTKDAVRYYYTQEERAGAKLGRSVVEWTYVKGLGTLELDDYANMIQKPVMDKVSLDSVEYLEIAFGDDIEKRKEWLL